MVDEEFRDDIKKQIEDKIILKFRKDTRYSEKAKQGIQIRKKYGDSRGDET